ncbi:alcohol dehydrogenase catalytic domain-containing protein [Streptomyces sp. NBC_01433]|uniref:zinc-dependent alcohol dehydrogenase n=1 Tax=Streptomyces sp. NBC_01433 TaxID=2903864 RepID=UPI002257D361|nr:alcohol dehydrogenase catalytic domain-containing protein [Streptomyces sp. NBC_01433]MCX4675582.1 alcohol dehydrogenase catalytic domain-containing protein [Streptomyces sp. NBC_01433]
MSAVRAWTMRGGSLHLATAPGLDATDDTTLIHVRYAGVCGSDIPKLSSSWRGPVPSPWFPGHEIVGTIARTVDWVCVDPLIGCRSCPACADGHVHLCQGLRRVGWDLPGGLAEAVRVPSASVVRLPALGDPAHGVLADAMAVAVHGVRCGLPTRPGRLGVIGTGAVAVCTAICAVRAGWEVHVAARSAVRRDQLHQALSDVPVAVHQRPLPPCDAVVDAASGQDDAPLRQALSRVRDGGTVVVQNAYAPRVVLSLPLRDLFRRSITVRGSYSYCRADGRDDFRDALTLLTGGGAWADLLTKDRYPLLDLPRALSDLRGADRRRPLKALLTADS